MTPERVRRMLSNHYETVAQEGGIGEHHCLTHASEMYDEGLCFETMARLYHETGGNNLSGLVWVNRQYGECKWLEGEAT